MGKKSPPAKNRSPEHFIQKLTQFYEMCRSASFLSGMIKGWPCQAHFSRATQLATDRVGCELCGLTPTCLYYCPFSTCQKLLSLCSHRQFWGFLPAPLEEIIKTESLFGFGHRENQQDNTGDWRKKRLEGEQRGGWGVHLSR